MFPHLTREDRAAAADVYRAICSRAYAIADCGLAGLPSRPDEQGSIEDVLGRQHPWLDRSALERIDHDAYMAAR